MTPFRILALSGGGARGIFQAKFLEELEEELGRPLGDNFDLIAGTSTGALVGLGVAAGIEVSAITDFYRRHASDIFRPQFPVALALLLRGPRYDQARLRSVLHGILGDKTLRDLERDVVIPTSVTNTFTGRVLTRKDDPRMPLLDVALAACAAPTYFPPVTPRHQEQAHMDGGLWASDPSLVAIQYATTTLRVPVTSIRLVSVGTGRIPRGATERDISRMRAASVGALKLVYEFMRDAQTSWVTRTTEEMLAPGATLAVNPVLPRRVALDDAKGAVSILPPIAEGEYRDHRVRLRSLLKVQSSQHLRPPDLRVDDVPRVLLEAIQESGLSKFIPARKYYQRYREGSESIEAYVGTAQESLTMVSVTLATGIPADNLIDRIDELLQRDPPVQVVISLLDPSKDHLMKTLAPVLNQSPDRLAQEIEAATEKLRAYAESSAVATSFQLWYHQAMPPASAILIDADSDNGRIQLETKPYKARGRESFGFEVQAGTEFYGTLVKSYRQLIRDGVCLYPSPDTPTSRGSTT